MKERETKIVGKAVAMIVRDLNEERCICIRQEDHADLAAQFAAHWGNGVVARSTRYDSIVAAAAYHDGHFRDVEAFLPIDLNRGRPYGHRDAPFWPRHLEALQENIAWVGVRDRFAALLVSMHHSGLPQNRYGVIGSWQNAAGKSPRKNPMRTEIAALIEQMETAQRKEIAELGVAEKHVWFNYRLLQVFDLLSLYLCCDGYGGDGTLQEARIGPIPIFSESDGEVVLRLIPVKNGLLRMDPYPFDCKALDVTVMTRNVPRRIGCSEAECRTEYWRSTRQSLTWEVTG